MNESADIVDRLNNTPNWMRESYGSWKDCVLTYDRAPFEAAAEITRLRAEAEALRKDAQKSERRAITFGDIMTEHILAMRAAVVAGHLESPAHGLQWIVNTLAGPGHLPDLDEARSLGGAQALFDKEMAEHDAFRAAHPMPDVAIAATKEQQA